MTRDEIDGLTRGMAVVIKEQIASSLAPVLARLKSAEEFRAIPGEKGNTGERGERGIDGAPGHPGTDGHPGEPGKQGEPGERGEPGQDGKPGEPGKDGKDGAPGEPGSPGHPAEPGKDGQDGRPGEQGEKGMPGERGTPGERGERGEKGLDGRSVTLDEITPMLEGAFAKWALEWERRASDFLQRAVDRIPKPADGIDGRDGFGFEHMGVDYDGARRLEIVFERGEESKRFPIDLPVPMDCGLWRQGASHFKADVVTYGGALWIAQRATTARPGDSTDWRLAVKRGSKSA